MSKTKKTNKAREAAPKVPLPAATAGTPVQTYAFRETVESIVIAFVLAFLFRTFEAEAFVIPTGSMAPTLMGRHKDVDCPKCGYRYQVSASEEESQDADRAPSDCIAGMCPLCHYVLPMRPDLPGGVPELGQGEIANQRSYNGDRILVNKYLYNFSDPKRWDVVVFKFPGDANVNYIKRLVGLPGETLRIYQGDLFVRPEGQTKDEDFKISRKPPEKVLAMRQLVHDTDYDPAELDAAGWPLRWHSPDKQADGWQIEKNIRGHNVYQRYSVDVPNDTTVWLRYENLVPNYDVWQKIDSPDTQPAAAAQPLFAGMNRSELRKLVTDSNPYNGRIDRHRIPFPGTLRIDPAKQGLHWVGDLMLEADVNIESASGQLLLDLVEGGRHFGCTIDLASGEAKMSAANLADYAPTAKTPLAGSGKHRVAFANFDDQLSLWIDGDLISFAGDTAYDANRVFGDRRRIRPETSEKDLGDLAPAAIGARGAKLSVSRLQLWRDIYYIADSYERNGGEPVTDFRHPLNLNQQILDLPYKPSLWDRFSERQKADFVISNEQLFVMGDNSAESSDARLWYNRGPRGGRPGGPYLERRLLIGKALCVYWPHSWNRIPGTPIPFPLFPNIADVRLVR